MTLPLDSAIHALALLILLRCLNVRFAPVVNSWQPLSLHELIEIHSILCQSKSEYWAQQVVLAMEHCYDWQSLDGGYGVLKEEWYRAVRNQQPFSAYVLSVANRLEQTMRCNVSPFFADGTDVTWSFQCQQALTSLHAGHESLVTMPEASLPSLMHLPSVQEIFLFIFGFTGFKTKIFGVLFQSTVLVIFQHLDHQKQASACTSFPDYARPYNSSGKGFLS